MTAAKAYRFGDWIVEPHLNRLSDGDRIVDVEPTTMDMLSFMLEHPGEILSIDQFLAKVWQGRIVEPNAVHRNITMIRRALGDDARKPRYVGNVRKRGYRTLAPVTLLAVSPENGEQAGDAAGQTSTGSGAINPRSRPEDPGRATVRTRTLAAVAVLILVASAWWTISPEPRSPADRAASPAVSQKSVAVLPFTDMSREGDQQYFGNGIAEELLDEFTRLEDLRVISRAASFAYWESGEDIRAISEALDVATVLHGSVRKSGSRLRITAQLIDARDGLQLWSKTYDRGVADIFAIQDEIAAEVAGVLGVTLGVGDANAFRGAGTASIEAYESYLRAMNRVPGRATQRTDLLRRAIQLDPDYAAALAALGLAIAGSSWRNPPQRAPALFEEGISFLIRAVETEPDSAFANALLGIVRYSTFDWRGSEAYFARSVEIQSTGRTLEDIGNMRLRAGRVTSAWKYFAEASEAELYPVTEIGRFDVYAQLALGDFAAARLLLEQGPLEASVDVATMDYEIALNRGDSAELKAAFERLAAASGPIAAHLSAVLQASDSSKTALLELRQIHADASAIWPSKYQDIAHLAAFFGDPAFALQVASAEARLMPNRYPSLLWLPVMAEARRLPAFKDLMVDVNLVDYWREYGWSDHCRPLGDDDFECF